MTPKRCMAVILASALSLTGCVEESTVKLQSLGAESVATMKAIAEEIRRMFEPPASAFEPSVPSPRVKQAEEVEHPLLRFLSEAQSGQSTSFKDPESGRVYYATAGRKYHAASGTRCRRYELFLSEGSAPISAGLACRQRDGRWTRIRGEGGTP